MQTQPELSVPTPSQLPADGQLRRIFDEATLREAFERGIAARLQRLELAQSVSITRTVIEIAGRQIDQAKGVDLATAARIVNLILRQEISNATKPPGRSDQWGSSCVTTVVRRLRKLPANQREAVAQFYLEGVSVGNIDGMQPEEFLKLMASLRSDISSTRKRPASLEIRRGLGNSRRAS